MTSNGLHDTGAEWENKRAYRSDDLEGSNELEIALYDDSTDDLEDADDVDDITTEPDDGNYERQIITIDSNDIELTNRGMTFLTTFDTEDTTGVIDSVAIIVVFESDDDDSPEPHLLTTIPIGSAELDDVSGFDVEPTVNR